MHSEKQAISSYAWLIEAIGMTGALLIASVAMNMSIDIYGIFRNANGRHLAVYGDERVAKYLLSEKYVPANFNAILIGSSVSANWNTGKISGFRVYNESIDGGNIIEEKAIADQALASSRIQVAILIVHPYLTASHDFNTVQLTPQENLGALGSQSLLDAYKAAARVKLHLEKPQFDEFGSEDFGDIPQKMNPHLQKLMTPGTEFSIDDSAAKAYSALVDELHSLNVRIVYVIPPVSESVLAGKASAFADYSRTMLANKQAQDRVIDFTSEEFSDFRRNPDNFKDGVHMTNQSAREVVAAIGARLSD